MLYSEYQVVYYLKSGSLKSPVKEYLKLIPIKDRGKIYRHIDLLWCAGGRLGEPYAKHIRGKLWELRARMENRYHRILYAIVRDKKIVLLSAFLKKSDKTPETEINKAHNYYIDYLLSNNL